MYSPCRNHFLIFIAAACVGLSWNAKGNEDCCGNLPTPPNPATERDPNVLRITADPNNLPFSNEKGEGFENKLADMIARELGMRIEWTWRAQRRGFFRETLKNDTADLILGAPAGYERALTTEPYYRSSYTFVYRKDRALNLRSLDDPWLRQLKIGVQIVGDDGANTPPAHALAMRGIVHNLVGFTLYGDYSEPNPPARIIDAVARGDIDVAIAWGPLAGYFAKRSTVPLEIVPVSPESEPNGLRYAFSVAMGVRKKDEELQKKVNEVLERKRSDVDRLLEDYGVPRVDRPKTASASGTTE